MTFKVVVDGMILLLYASNKGCELVSVQNKSFHHNLLNTHMTYDLYWLKERCLTSSGASNTLNKHVKLLHYTKGGSLGESSPSTMQEFFNFTFPFPFLFLFPFPFPASPYAIISELILLTQGGIYCVSTLSVSVGRGFLANTHVSLTSVLNSGKEQCCHDKDLR